MIKYSKTILGVVIILLVIGSGIYFYSNSSLDSVVRLTNITSVNLVESAGIYEGLLIFTDIKTGKETPLFICSKSWDFVKADNCYIWNDKNIQKNIDSHKYSAELSGCYVGELKVTSC